MLRSPSAEAGSRQDLGVLGQLKPQLSQSHCVVSAELCQAAVHSAHLWGDVPLGYASTRGQEDDTEKGHITDIC